MDVREKLSSGKRLIDANTLMDVIRQHEYRLATKQGSIDYGMFTLGIQQAVDEQPTVDAVEVVRCKDCKHYRPQKKSAHWKNRANYCNRIVTIKVQPYDFCSYGERKEGAN